MRGGNSQKELHIGWRQVIQIQMTREVTAVEIESSDFSGHDLYRSKYNGQTETHEQV